MSNDKKYKLLKDLPNVKAGSLFKPVSALAYANIDTKWHVEYCNEIVETNKDWFEEVVEQPKERIYVCNIHEVYNKYRDKTRTKEYSFVTSEKIPEEKLYTIGSTIEQVLNNDKVEESKCAFNELLLGTRWLELANTPIYTQQQLDEEKKKAEYWKIEFYAASDRLHRLIDKKTEQKPVDWDEHAKNVYQSSVAPVKDWEVVCFVGNGRNFWRQRNGGYHSEPLNGDFSEEYFLKYPEVYKIHSVKRLSDGVVFSVGDEVTRGEKFGKETIKMFEISNTENPGYELLFVHFNESHTFSNFIFVQKLPSPKPSPLFTTEDGVEMFENMEYWAVGTLHGYDTYQCRIAPNNNSKKFYNKSILKFSTKEKAEEYVLTNKPCLSVKDAIECWTIAPRYSPIYNSYISNVKEFSKRKINTI